MDGPAQRERTQPVNSINNIERMLLHSMGRTHIITSAVRFGLSYGRSAR